LLGKDSRLIGKIQSTLVDVKIFKSKGHDSPAGSIANNSVAKRGWRTGGKGTTAQRKAAASAGPARVAAV
jgi:hypothetical protein